MRKRMEDPVLKSWDEVDATLKLISECENQLAILESSMNIQIDAIKEGFNDKATPYKEEIKKQEAMIKEFVSENKGELKGKSRELTFGRVGFRFSTKVSLPKNVEKIIKLLRKNEMEDCIIVKETVNKDILKAYDERDIIKVGASLKKEDTFWYETRKEDSLTKDA